MTSVAISNSSLKPQPRHLLDAHDYLFEVTAALDSADPANFSEIGTLSRLKTNLAAAISAHEMAIKGRLADEAIWMKQTDLLWQCNQCDYYLNKRAAIALPGRQLKKDRSLWQIRAAVAAVVHFKLLTYLRKIMPGANIMSLPWRDILPGFRLWLM